jgi:hypothetical protein
MVDMARDHRGHFPVSSILVRKSETCARQSKGEAAQSSGQSRLALNKCKIRRLQGIQGINITPAPPLNLIQRCFDVSKASQMLSGTRQ